jgi:hypothetical protein
MLLYTELFETSKDWREKHFRARIRRPDGHDACDLVCVRISTLRSTGPPEQANRFLGRYCLYVKLDSVNICTETFFIFQEILRATSDTGASMQFDRRPMALPYPYGRRLEADHIHFSGRSLHQPTDVRPTTGNDLLKVGCNLDKFWSPSARSIQRLRPIRFHMIAIQPRFP